MDTSSRKRPVRAVILLGFLMAIVAVALMGKLAYESVNELSDKLQKAAEEDPYLAYLKLIVADLTTAESNVRAYTITQDAEKDLPECFRAIQQIDQHLEKIEDEELYYRKDSFEYVLELISSKKDILEQLIETVDTGDVETTFEKFRAEIDRLAVESSRRNRKPLPDIQPIQTEMPTASPPAEPQPDSVLEAIGTEAEKAPFRTRLKKFFSLKKREEEEEAVPNQVIPIEETVDTPPQETEDIATRTRPNTSPPNQSRQKPASQNPSSPHLVEDLQISVSELEQADLIAMEVRRYNVARLTREGQDEMRQLKNYVRALEAKQLIATQSLADQAEDEAGKTSRFIAWFSGAVWVLCIVLMAVIFSDFARNARLTRKLENEKSRAEKLAKVKEDFLANMSHEIRTPMNAVMGFAEQMAGTQLNSQQNRFLQPIRNSAHYLLALINDILDYSKLESGRFELEKTPFRPAELLGEVLQTVQPLADKKGISLHQKGFASLPPVLKGDPLRLRQMLFNLMGNAIKFTQKGSVSLFASSVAGEDGYAQIRFEVRDTGVGISKDQLEKVFQNFVQADSSTTRRFGGTGLGLSITRKLAELHGGRVAIQSELGQGTSVSLLLPYLVGKKEDLPFEALTVNVPPETLAGKRFLVADDEPYNLELIQVILEKWQVEADVVGDGRRAIEHLANRTYDLVLLDLRMPEMDGVTVAQYARQELQLSVPILALTATSTQEEISQALQSGIDGHLLKPFQESELLAKVSHLLGVPVQGPDSEPISIDDQDQEPKSVPAGFSLQHLRKLTNHNPQALNRMLHLFLKSAEGLNVDMQKAMDKEDWPELSMKAHRLIPPCRHLGMDELVENLRQLESLANAETDIPQLKETYQAVKTDLDTLLQLVKKELAEIAG